jgi:hypothetical protein
MFSRQPPRHQSDATNDLVFDVSVMSFATESNLLARPVPPVSRSPEYGRRRTSGNSLASCQAKQCSPVVGRSQPVLWHRCASRPRRRNLASSRQCAPAGACRRVHEGLGGRGPGGAEAARWRREMRGRHCGTGLLRADNILSTVAMHTRRPVWNEPSTFRVRYGVLVPTQPGPR